MFVGDVHGMTHSVVSEVDEVFNLQQVQVTTRVGPLFQRPKDELDGVPHVLLNIC